MSENPLPEKPSPSEHQRYLLQADQDSPRWALAFFTIWSGQALSLLGSQLVQFALIWHLTKVTESAAVLATATLVGLLPQVVLGPIVGTLVDRWDRQRIMLTADTLIAAATLVLALFFALGRTEIWPIYLIMFLRSLGGGFHRPAMAASTSLMVPEEHLTRVQGANQTLQGALNIISAPLGALLLEVLPLQGILALDVISALFAVIPLLVIRIPQTPAESALKTHTLLQGVWEDFQVGLKYILDWRGLSILILMAIAINMIITPSFSLLPLLVREHFGGGAVQLGWIESTFGIGSVLGGIILSGWGGFTKKIHTVLAGLFFEGAGLMLVGIAPSDALSLAIAGVFILAVSLAVVNGPIIAMLQAVVDPGLQGRVFSLVGSLTSLASPLGLIIAGPLAEITDVQTWFIVGGIIAALLGLGGFFIPSLLAIETNHQTSQRTPSTQEYQHGA